MPKSKGLFAQGDLLGVETFGDVHAKAHIHVGNGSVITVNLFGDKKTGKCHPITAELNKLGEGAGVCLSVKYEVARGNFDAGFSGVALVPVAA